MPRKGPAPRRVIPPDPVYNDVLVQRFINRLMVCGKKSVAEKIFYRAMEIVGERTKRNPLEVFHQALKNVMPVLEVRPRRVGGATYQVPMEVRPERRISLGIRWLVTSARKRGGRTMIEKLAAEIMDAANNQGAAVKKREDTHRMAEANKAFAHYRW
ncbi:MAG: 30S ribosomal protein S7 [Firmicutes bacterium]|jgi:small subunit ribosomal protein S7|nr:30S ribosomal protein S7 [Bacillota bacterium]